MAVPAQQGPPNSVVAYRYDWHRKRGVHTPEAPCPTCLNVAVTERWAPTRWRRRASSAVTRQVEPTGTQAQAQATAWANRFLRG
jgi:hypothetical protein